MLISHPDKSLYEHLKNTFDIGYSAFKQKRLSFKAFSEETLENIIKISLLTHDFGKAMSYFQEYMRDIERGETVIRHKDSELKNHGLISGLLAFNITRKMTGDDAAAFLVYMAVSKHHGNHDNLSRYSSEPRAKKETLIKQYDSLNLDEMQELSDSLELEYDFKDLTRQMFINDIEYMSNFRLLRSVERKLNGLQGYLLLNFVFSLLIFSDKLEAIFYSEGTPLEEYMEELSERCMIDSAVVEDYKRSIEIKNPSTAKLRETIYQDVLDSTLKLDLSQNILSINLPTGAGKTLAALKCSLVLKERLEKEKGMKPRIIYLLPYTSIIEQNYEVMAKVIKTEENKLILKHHHLSERVYKDDEGVLYEGSTGEHLIETWESEIIVSTFVQFLHSVFTNKNRQLKKFHNISNSIIILDEVQSIPYRYWLLIKEVFKSMSEVLNCKFILMTATMPLIFDEERGEIFELATKKSDYFNKFNRININAGFLKTPFTINEFKAFMINEINRYSDNNFLIVLNTIKSSIDVYKALEEEFGSDCSVIYLSTNIIPRDRRDRIRFIKKGKGRKIIVSTQMIEAGVDIDIDRVYRDLGPMDSINQTAGRCNREGNSEEKGQVILVSLKDENNKEKDYYKYVYDNILMESTAEALGQVETIEEREIYKFSKAYFSSLKKHSSEDESTGILKMIEDMNIRDAFEFDAEKKNKVFEMIPKSFKTVDVFIELDEAASEVWGKYEQVKKIKNRFERKRELNKFKKDLYDYVVSVPETAVKKHLTPSEHDMTKITWEMVFNVYDLKTGFIRDQVEDFIF